MYFSKNELQLENYWFFGHKNFKICLVLVLAMKIYANYFPYNKINPSS